jgi:GT2 family glycosyltransferase
MMGLALLEEIPWRIISYLPAEKRLWLIQRYSPSRYIKRRRDAHPQRVARVTDHLIYGAGKRRSNADAWTDETYRLWVAVHDVWDKTRMDGLRRRDAALAVRPLVSVAVVGSDDIELVRKSAASVVRQAYPNWELCTRLTAAQIETIAGDFGDARVRLRGLGESRPSDDLDNAVLAHARGDIIVLVEAGDELSPDALLRLVEAFVEDPRAQMIFSDEDALDENGQRRNPIFKSDWNPALMLSRDAFGGLGAYRRAVLQRAEGFRTEAKGAETYDLALRCAEIAGAATVRHIPRILYHRAVKTPLANAWEAGARAVGEALRREGIEGSVARRLETCFQVNYAAPAQWPPLSILLPTTLGGQVQARCLESLLRLTTYPDFEIVLAISRDHDARTRQAPFDRILADPRVRLFVYDHKPFNFSWVNNRAAKAARGEYLCLLNDDVEVETSEWAQRLVRRAMLPGVGAVGAMLYFPDGAIQHAGVILGIGGIAAHVGHAEPRGWSGYWGRAALEQDLSCVTGACMALPRAAFEAVGMLDETLPVAFNDVDLCLKLRRKGYRVIWTPAVEMIHHESSTFGRHDEGERGTAFRSDSNRIRERWGSDLDADPFYNPNLSKRFSAIYQLSAPRDKAR